MQTQGISLIASEISGMASAKSTKATDATFQSFMSERASKVDNKSTTKTTEVKTSGSGDSYEEKKTTVKAGEPRKEIADSQKQDITDSSKTKTDTVKTEDVVEEELDVTAMNRQMMQILKDVSGLNEEEVQDILEQMGIGLQDLMFQIQNGEITAVSVETLQALVMEVHGVADKAAFLTNADLNRELNLLIQQTTELVADAIGVSVDELAEAEQSLMLSFSEQMQQSMENMNKENVTEETSNVSETMKEEGMSQHNGEIQVVVETENDGSKENEQNNSMNGTAGDVSVANEATSDMKTAVNLFTEKLEQALEQDGIKTETAGKTMSQIVEQVVNQVKIRVMPETTSMELQLHPASLGRVNLQVSTTNGTATAMLTVENQIAKEALESQLITLKETFAEQGLKVDAVEVTVSEFGLDQKNQEAAKEQQKQSTGKRRFRVDEDLVTDEFSENEKETDVTRRDVNSVVDYTA